jgi:hypothetical protein
MLTIASVKWHQQSLNYIDLAHIDSGGFSTYAKRDVATLAWRRPGTEWAPTNPTHPAWSPRGA